MTPWHAFLGAFCNLVLVPAATPQSETCDEGEGSCASLGQGLLQSQSAMREQQQQACSSTPGLAVPCWNHSWDFRNASGSSVKDQESNLMARVRGENPQWSPQGLFFNGKSTKVSLDKWPIGGDMSFEVYLAFDKNAAWKAHQIVFDFSDHDVFQLTRSQARGEWHYRQYPEHRHTKSIRRDFWQLGKWTHVVCTINSRKMELFVDGRLLGTQTTGYPYRAHVAKRNFNWIGSVAGRYHLFHGTFAYMRIWQGITLDAAAVKALYEETTRTTTTTTTTGISDQNETLFDKLDQDDDGQLDKKEFDVFWPPGGR